MNVGAHVAMGKVALEIQMQKNRFYTKSGYVNVSKILTKPVSYQQSLAKLWWMLAVRECSLVMATLCNRGPLYFCPVISIVYLLSFFPLPNLSGYRLDLYHTSTHGVALV